ncbi:MAG: alanine--tRNA ligase [bacterium]
MTSKEIRAKFLKFFEDKGHAVVPSSSLIPDDDSVLLTIAGIQQFVPYLSGEVEPPYKRACSAQKCVRAGGKHNDLDEVGDDTHHTFFEMLGNWSFGDYFKSEAIDFALEFLTKECGISEDRLVATIFKGEGEIERDEESYNLWLQKGFTKDKIFEFGMKDNFWGPTANTGPCGPSSEIHYDKTGQSCECGEKCNPECSCGRFVEIWNLVFMEYNKTEDGKYKPLPHKNVDTGIGFERLVAILQNKKTAYDTDLFLPLMKKIDVILSEAKNLVEGDEIASLPLVACNDKVARVIADHIRAVCFMIADGITPSNTERGYILRRLLRRIIGQGKLLNLPEDFLNSLVEAVAKNYGDVYLELKENKGNILEIIKDEKEKFSKTIERGLKEFEKRCLSNKSDKLIIGTVHDQNILYGEDAFYIYQTYGLPREMMRDICINKGIKFDDDGFKQELKKHQELSRAGAEKKFGGHGIGDVRVFAEGDEEKATKLHTATHLLHQALQDVLGTDVRQMGSDINPERLRFDFSYSEKLTPEKIKQVEDIVNQKIKENLPITVEEINKEEAIKLGAKAFFKAKYGDVVKVYSIGDYSKEICGGPHTKNTGDLGKFRITKEQSSSAGVRRIKAVLE